MDDKIYTVTLADGTELSGLRLNGNNFISENEISAGVFAGNCSTVVISDGETSETYENMALIHVTKMADGYWFALRELSKQELTLMKMQSDIDYVAMMANVEL